MSDVQKQDEEESVAQDSVSLTLSTYSNVPSLVLFVLNSLCIQKTIISHALHIASDMPSPDPDTLSIPALSCMQRNSMRPICKHTEWKALLESKLVSESQPNLPTIARTLLHVFRRVCRAQSLNILVMVVSAKY